MSVNTIRRSSAATATAAGLILLAAYAAGIQLPSVLPPPWAGLAFLLTGIALWIDHAGRAGLIASPAAGAIAFLIGAVIWLEYLTSKDFGFDRLLFPQSLLSAALHPGRPSPMAAFNFILVGLALLLFSRRRWEVIVVRDACAVSSITFSYFALIDYFFRLVSTPAPVESMSPVSSVLFMAISISVLANHPDGPLLVILRNSGPAGSFARWLMPVPLILPVVASLVRLGAQHCGLLGSKTSSSSFSAFSLVIILAAILIVWGGSSQVFRVDERRRKLEEELRASRDDLDARVRERTQELLFANQALEQTHRELQETNLTLTNVIAASPLGICAFHADGTVRQKNPAAENLFAGRPDTLSNLFDRASQGETITGAEMTHLGADGTANYLNVWASPMFASNGSLNGVVVIGADVSERRAFENHLRHAQKLESLGVLAGGIAHDFNNLLTGILGNATLLLETLSPDDPQRTCVDHVVMATQRAADLTRQMLAYAGKGRFVIEQISLSHLVEETNSLLQSSIPKSVQLRVQGKPDIPFMEGDASQIQQVIMNLVMNGAEAIQGSGSVVIRIDSEELDPNRIRNFPMTDDIRPGLFVTLEVADTGTGMSEETQARIFDPFFTTKFTGRGLGLAAVQGIVRGHKGALRVFSSLDAGTTFKIWFPAASPRRTAAETPPSFQLIHRGSGVILVIDDESIVRQTAKSALENVGYEVLLAANGEEGVRLFEGGDHAILAILLDLTMPGLSGPETFKRLKLLNPDVPIILSSGFSAAEVIQSFPAPGPAEFIQKPYTMGQLAAKLRTVLGSQSPVGVD